MAITAVAARGLGTGGPATGTTTTITPTATIVVGRQAVLVLSTDNIATATGVTNIHTGVADTSGNAWSKLGEYTMSAGSAASGVTVSVWVGNILTQLTTGSTITATHSSVAERVASAYEFSVGSGNILAAVGSVSNQSVAAANGFGSSTISGLASADTLFFRGMGKEANSTTALTVTASHTAITNTRSRNNASAETVYGEFIILTGTADTSNPTLAVSGNAASVMVALREQAAIYSATITEAGIGGEAGSRTMAALASSTEAASAGESGSSSMVAAASSTEAGAASESRSSSMVASADYVDVTPLTLGGIGVVVPGGESGLAIDVDAQEAVSAAVQATIAEAGSAGDAGSRSMAATASLTEPGAAGEAGSSTMVAARSATEAGTAGDTSTGASAASRTEAAAAVDAPTRSLAAVSISITEAAAASEAGASATAATRTEAGAASDAVGGIVDTSATLTEIAIASDAGSRSLAPVAISITEAAIASDAGSSTMSAPRSITEPGAASDAGSSTMIASRSATEAGAAIDAGSSTAASSRSATEAANATDAASTSATMSVSTIEALAASSSESAGVTITIGITEIAAASAVADGLVNSDRYVFYEEPTLLNQGALGAGGAPGAAPPGGFDAVQPFVAAVDDVSGYAFMPFWRYYATLTQGMLGLGALADSPLGSGAIAGPEAGTAEIDTRDAAAVAALASATEATNAGEASSRVMAATTAAIEAALADTFITAEQYRAASVTEVAAASEAIAAWFISIRVEGANAIDVSSALKTISMEIVEGALAADAASPLRLAQVAEAAAATDAALAILVPYARGLVEASAATDAALRALTASASSSASAEALATAFAEMFADRGITEGAAANVRLLAYTMNGSVHYKMLLVF